MPKPRAILAFPGVIAREALTRSDHGRTPEPMVMGEPLSVAAFHEAGRVDGSNMPMYEICARAMSRLLPEGGTVLDLGSGSGRFLVHLARHRHDVRIVGLDLAKTMIAAGRQLIDEEGLSERITLLEADITMLAARIPDRVDVISSIWALHHLPRVEHLDACLSRVAALREERACAVFLADFARFKNSRSFPLLISAVAGIPPALKSDGVASERAAWSFGELTDALERAGLGDLQHALARPLRVLQMHWTGASAAGDHELWRELELPPTVRFDSGFWLHSMRELRRDLTSSRRPRARPPAPSERVQVEQ